MRSSYYRRRKKSRGWIQPSIKALLFFLIALGSISVPFAFKYSVFGTTSPGSGITGNPWQPDSGNSTPNPGSVSTGTGNPQPDSSNSTPDQSTASVTPGQPQPLLAENQYYFRSVLSKEDAQLYDSLLKGFLNYEESISINITSPEEITYMIFNMVLADHPEIFYIESYSYVPGVMVSPNYSYTKKEVMDLQGKINHKVDAIRTEIGRPNSEYDLVKTVYEYIANHVDYDLQSPDNQNIISSILNEVSVCAGYAKMLVYILQSYGMQAVQVSGDIFNGGPHAWVIVKVDGEYYQCDPTYGDGSYTTGSSFINYDYLCIPDSKMMVDRMYSQGKYLPPECTSERFI